MARTELEPSSMGWIVLQAAVNNTAIATTDHDKFVFMRILR